MSLAEGHQGERGSPKGPGCQPDPGRTPVLPSMPSGLPLVSQASQASVSPLARWGRGVG